MNDDQTKATDLAGGRLEASPGEIRLFFPCLFGEHVIVLSSAEIAYLDRLADGEFELGEERLAAGGEALEIVELSTRRNPLFNLAIFRAQPGLLPPVRLRARLTVRGFLYHRGRRKPHDGYLLECLDAERAVRMLTNSGVQRTDTPYVWARARRQLPL